MAVKQGCKGAPAALVIHGIADSRVPLSRGAEQRDHFARAASCQATTAPPLAEVEAKIRAARQAGRQETACADYAGCARPVRWCVHSEGGYDGTTHGWPRTAGGLIRDLLDALWL